MPNTAILGESEYGLAEAAILSERLLSPTTLSDILARPAIVTAADEQPTPVLCRVVLTMRGPGLRIKLYANHRLSSTFSKSVEAVAELLSLPRGWNSYAAKPISPQNAVRAIRLLAEFLEPQTPSPIIVPRVRGGIQLEWHTKGMNIEIYIESPTDVSFFAEEAGSGKSSEVRLSGNERELKSWLQRLAGE